MLQSQPPETRVAPSHATSPNAWLERLITWIRQPLLLFLVALILRLAVLALFLEHNQLLWGANEAGGIARYLVLGQGFASPFHDATGPTAWLAPVYPSLLASLFLIFGIQTAAAAKVAVLLNALFGSVTAVLVRRLGAEQFGEPTGLVAGWAWAVSPPVVVMSWYLWETSLSALVMTFALLQTLRLTSGSSQRRWISCGLIWSFAALLNPALAAPLPVFILVKAWKTRRWKHASAMLLACLIGIAPWTVRSVVSLHHIVPVRDNFWPELYFGNVTFSLHPTGSSMLYQNEGEIAFTADLRTRMIGYLRNNPGDFLRHTGQRIILFWTEPSRFKPLPALLALAALAGIFFARTARREWLCFLAVLAFYPLVYYISYTFTRYRHPIEPVLYLLAGFTLVQLVNMCRARFSPHRP